MADSPSRFPSPLRLAEDSIAPVESPREDPWRRPLSWCVATNLGKSFYYAGRGLLYAVRTQRNFRIHLLAAVLAFGLGLALRLSAVEMALISLTSGLVMALELVNTALEAVVDLTLGSRYHLLAEVAKDCAAGAVLVAALASVAVAAWLFLRPCCCYCLGICLPPFKQKPGLARCASCPG
jgi:diacylglycerol kinase (ATP)